MSEVDDARAIMALAWEMKPFLAGKSTQVQGGALADLVALWLAGHHIPGNEEATDKLREQLFDVFCAVVRKLIGTLP